MKSSIKIIHSKLQLVMGGLWVESLLSLSEVLTVWGSLALYYLEDDVETKIPAILCARFNYQYRYVQLLGR